MANYYLDDAKREEVPKIPKLKHPSEHLIGVKGKTTS